MRLRVAAQRASVCASLPFVSLAWMRRERAALSVSQLCFLQLGHAAMTASIQRGRRGQPDLLTHLLHDLFEPAKRVQFAIGLVIRMRVRRLR